MLWNSEIFPIIWKVAILISDQSMKEKKKLKTNNLTINKEIFL